MDALIQRLAQARQIHIEYQDELAGLEQEIQQMVDEIYGRGLERVRSLLATAQADLADAENAARQRALLGYLKDGEKKPHPAVQIKIYTTLAYGLDDAKKFCIEKHPDALKLDKRAFEKAAKVLRPDCVTVESEPRPTIAQDLSQYLGGDE